MVHVKEPVTINFSFLPRQIYLLVYFYILTTSRVNSKVYNSIKI